jgi:hypothetical protein
MVRVSPDWVIVGWAEDAIAAIWFARFWSLGIVMISNFSEFVGRVEYRPFLLG